MLKNHKPIFIQIFAFWPIFIVNCGSIEVSQQSFKDEAINEEFDGKIWALLVAGSRGYDNYRHQADVCHAYQLLKRNGIQSENIIVMMYDDIANSTENPLPGRLVNYPGGPDVYEGVVKDYTGEDVTSTNFLNVIKGNLTGMKHIGSGKVINSTRNDNIFIFFSGHGGSGALFFPEDTLTVDDFIEALKQTAGKGSFNKMAIYVEACEAGSMFDDVLDDDLNIFAMTASDPNESSWGCYCENEQNTCLGDCFSLNWMCELEKTQGNTTISLHHLFEKVRTKTSNSHVEEYGNLNIGSEMVSAFLGKTKNIDGKWTDLYLNSYDEQHSIRSEEIALKLLERKFKHFKVEERRSLKMELELLIEKRNQIDKIFSDIAEKLSRYGGEEKNKLTENNFHLGRDNVECYSKILKHFSNNCINVATNPFAIRYLRTFINACSLKWLSKSQIMQAIHYTCTNLREISGAV